jgi:signal peptidase I
MVDRPGRWVLAGLLSLIAPGLGQIYNGEWAKALVLLAVAVPLVILFVILLFTPHFYLALPLAVLFTVVIWAYAFIDAIRGTTSAPTPSRGTPTSSWGTTATTAMTAGSGVRWSNRW